MAKKNRPRKPTRPLGSAIFAKSGRVCLDVEHLPSTQEDIELVIGHKFIGGLDRFHGIKLSGLARGEEPADLTCHDAHGNEIYIQLVEAVDRALREREQQRVVYTKALNEFYNEIAPLYDGCVLSLISPMDDPLLPPLNSKLGKQAFNEILTYLRELGVMLDTLGTNNRRIRRWRVGGTEILADCERLAPRGSGVPFQVRSPGNFLAGGLADLCEAIRGKLKRQYSKPSSEFWLLVHSTDIVPLQPADAQVTNAEQLLSSRAHPFDKVWYLFPYSNKDYGHVLLIWPRPEGGERCGVA